MIAGLPMYDLPGLEGAHDRLWDGIGGRLRAEGVDAPLQLARGLPLQDFWTAPDLLLGQTCGYPLAKHLSGRVQVLAIPVYTARGCDGTNHRSLVLARKDDHRAVLSQFRGARLALNEATSNTGMNLLRAEIAPLIGTAGEAFFSTVHLTGSHSASLDAVIDGEADIAAVDCVTFALSQTLRPQRLEQLRIVALTAPTPGLPLIASISTPPKTILIVRDVLAAAVKDPDLKPVLAALLIEDFAYVPQTDYRSILDVEQFAIDRGYPHLR